MGFNDTLPFLRGETYFGIGRKHDDDAGNNIVGREYVHQDDTYDTGGWVRVRVCRNVSGIKLLPGKCVSFRMAPGRLLNTEVVGYAVKGVCESSAVVDDLLKYQVPKNDLFYVVVSGPCLAYPMNDNIRVGDQLHVGVEGSSQATDPSDKSGRVRKASFDYTGYDLACAMGHIVGRAMSSVTAGGTYRDRILIQAGFGSWK